MTADFCHTYGSNKRIVIYEYINKTRQTLSSDNRKLLKLISHGTIKIWNLSLLFYWSFRNNVVVLSLCGTKTKKNQID